MVKRLAKIIVTFVAAVGFYLSFPAHIVLAASNQLDLPAEDIQAVAPPSMVGLFFRLVVSLAIIVGLAYLVMRLMRKNMRVLSRGSNISVLDQYSLSLNKGIYITQIAGKVYVLGVSDHNISLISEVKDQELIDEMVRQARDREMEPIIPASVLERVLPSSLFTKSGSGSKPFNSHIQKQVKKLQSMVQKRDGISREDDTND